MNNCVETELQQALETTCTLHVNNGRLHKLGITSARKLRKLEISLRRCSRATVGDYSDAMCPGSVSGNKECNCCAWRFHHQAVVGLLAEESDLQEGYKKATCGVGCVFLGEAQSEFGFLTLVFENRTGVEGARWFGPVKRVRLQVRVGRL
jgi:hypothetical protein